MMLVGQVYQMHFQLTMALSGCNPMVSRGAPVIFILILISGLGCVLEPENGRLGEETQTWCARHHERHAETSKLRFLQSPGRSKCDLHFKDEV